MAKPVNTAEIRPAELFAGKNILLSGTTGFLGKVVLSMLLTRYPQVGRVFALIRPGVSERARDRFNKTVATSPALRPLVEAHGENIAAFLDEKVTPLDGDITKPNCGLSPESLALLEREGLHVVMNSAGLVDFDPPVDAALSINAHGAENVVSLARTFNAALVHVSTCFVAGQQSGQILEDDPIVNHLPPGHRAIADDFDFRNEIKRLDEMAEEVRRRAEDPVQRARWRQEAGERLEDDGRDPEDQAALKAAILRQRKKWLNEELRRVGMERAHFWGWTNTYTFTKSLGEMVIAAAASEGLNACVVRPSIVESAFRFPFPGWNEGFTTTAPLILIITRGLPHMPHGDNLLLDVVPCDMVAGAIIAAAAACLAGPHKLIFQAASGDTNPLTVKKSIELTAFYGRQKAKRKGAKGLIGFWQRHHETETLTSEAFGRYSAPAASKLAAQLVRAIDTLGPDRFGWIRQPASVVRDFAAEIHKGSARFVQVLDLFLPFIVENKYVFRTDNLRHLMSRLPADDRAFLGFAPWDYAWRDYWLNVHVPGLEKWVFPKLEEEMAEKPKQVYMFRDLLELFDSVTHAHRHRIAFQLLRKKKKDGSQPDGEHLTYGELRKLARRVAAYLVDRGVAPDDRVLLISENRPEWAAAYFGILSAGATVVPVDAQARAAEIANIAKTAGAKGVILSPKLGKLLMADGAGPEVVASSGAAVWLLHDCVRHPKELTEPRQAARVASLIFTSGTTGHAKGVMLSQRNFTFEVSRLAGIFKLGVDDHMLSVLPLHHTFEFTAGLLMPLSRGARVTYLSALDGELLERALKQGVTGLIGVPALWQLLERRIEAKVSDKKLAALVLDGVRALNTSLRERTGLNVGPLAAYPVHRALGGRLKYLVSGGSALSPEVMSFFRGLGFNLTEGYGLTETAPVLTVTSPKEKAIAGSVGKPLPGVEIRIADANDEGVGEILAKGPNLMLGYFGDEQATAGVIEDGWLRTGDLGRLDDKGRLFIVGRKKDVIIDADGKNVYPDEVEELYAGHARIKELSVVGLPQPDRGEKVAALVVPKYDDDRGRDEVRTEIEAHLRKVSETLPFPKRIKIHAFWDGELPRTSTRKVKRPLVIKELERLVKVQAEVQEAGPVDLGMPVDLVRRAIAALTGKSAEAIEPGMRLGSDLGFDSLMFVELAAALESHARADLSGQDLMAVEKVEDVAKLLRKAETAMATQSPAKLSTRTPEAGLTLPAPLVSLGKRLLGAGQRLFYEKVMDMQVGGREYIPRDQGFLVAANHTSHLDAGLVKIALGRFGRNMMSLAARDYFFDSKIRRMYFENFTNLVPIERHGQVKQSLRRALATLEQNHVVLLFPEGTRSPDGSMQPFKSTVGYLAVAGRRPVLPMYLWGTYEAMPKGSTLIPRSRKIGALMGPALRSAHFERLAGGRSRNDAYRLATLLVERAVQALKEQGGYKVEELVEEIEREVMREQAPVALLSAGAVPASDDVPATGRGNGKRKRGARSVSDTAQSKPRRPGAGRTPHDEETQA